MELQQQDGRPIFMTLAEQIEDGILMGAFAEETQIPSITEYSVRYQINPATALKAINLLVDEDVVYKKRGLGMFVKEGARDILKSKRTSAFYKDYIAPLLSEAQRLGLDQKQLIELIQGGEPQ